MIFTHGHFRSDIIIWLFVIAIIISMIISLYMETFQIEILYDEQLNQTTCMCKSDTLQVREHNVLVNRPTRWSLLFILGFLYWSSHPYSHRNIVLSFMLTICPLLYHFPTPPWSWQYELDNKDDVDWRSWWLQWRWYCKWQWKGLRTGKLSECRKVSRIPNKLFISLYLSPEYKTNFFHIPFYLSPGSQIIS